MTLPATRTGALARVATGLTALLLTSGLLSACAEGSDSPGASATSSAAQEATTEPEDDTATTSAESAGIGYTGEDGRTALELLQTADPSVEVSGEGDQAYVVGIGGYTADESKNEFWALYVNGEQAQVGAGALETTDGDEIEWKLETY
ncbi:DUF4430 domain-containing protein [Cellulosimicrobium terreum]|nr:DUF4430 domain-containing protein [Cellulosimicrobium terreum]